MIYSQTKSVLADFDELMEKSAVKKAEVLGEKIKDISRRTDELWRKRRMFFGKNVGKIYRRLADIYKNASDASGRFLEKGFNWQNPLEKTESALNGIADFSVSTRTASAIRKLSKDIRDFFDIYESTPVVELSATEKDFMLKISASQKINASKTDDFARKIMNLWRQSAQFPDELISDVKKARREMDNSSNALSVFDPSEAAAAQEKALYWLEKISGKFSSMSFSLPGGKPSAIPGFAPSSGGTSFGGASGFSERNFEIPVSGKSGYDALLEEINKAKKTSQPEKYRDLLENYYNELSK